VRGVGGGVVEWDVGGLELGVEVFGEGAVGVCVGGVR